MAEPMVRVGDALINPAYVAMIAVTAGTWDDPQTVVVTMSTGLQTTYSGAVLQASLIDLKVLSGGQLCKYMAPQNSDDLGTLRKPSRGFK